MAPPKGEIDSQAMRILPKPIPMLSSTIATSHMWLFEFKSIKLK